MIVNRNGELVGPVAKSVANQHVATLPAGLLLLWPEQLVEKPLDAGIDPHAPSGAVLQRKILLATRARIDIACDIGTRARACKHQLAIDQRLQGLSIDCITLALPDDGTIERKAEPREIFQDRGLIFRARS